MNKTAFPNNAHETALTAKHAHLEARIIAEAKRTVPNPNLLTQLKKAKLKIKDRLSAT